MNRKVLVVDDEPEVTFSLQAFFLAKGYEMLTALDGVQALKVLRTQPVDLVLLDMKMPGVNGVEVLNFIRSECPSTKVVVVTAYDAQFQDRVEQLGVDGFLIKPFGIQALTRTVEDVLLGKPIRPAAAPDRLDTDGPRPRARLLFLEPSEYTYRVKELFFSDPERSGGEYEVRAAYSEPEALRLLKEWRPDLLLVDLSVLKKGGEALSKMADSPDRPKEIILHGSGSVRAGGPIGGAGQWNRAGVKVVQNESFTRAGLIRLAESVREAALANGLAGQ